MTYGKPFNRKTFLMNLIYYVEKGYCSYKEAMEMSMVDFIELKVAIESKQQEEQITKSLGDVF